MRKRNERGDWVVWLNHWPISDLIVELIACFTLCECDGASGASGIVRNKRTRECSAIWTHRNIQASKSPSFRNEIACVFESWFFYDLLCSPTALYPFCTQIDIKAIVYTWDWPCTTAHNTSLTQYKMKLAVQVKLINSAYRDGTKAFKSIQLKYSIYIIITWRLLVLGLH